MLCGAILYWTHRLQFVHSLHNGMPSTHIPLPAESTRKSDKYVRPMCVQYQQLAISTMTQCQNLTFHYQRNRPFNSLDAQIAVRAFAPQWNAINSHSLFWVSRPLKGRTGRTYLGYQENRGGVGTCLFCASVRPPTNYQARHCWHSIVGRFHLQACASLCASMCVHGRLFPIHARL